MNYQYTLIFFALEIWEQFYYSAEKIIGLCLNRNENQDENYYNFQRDILKKTLPMLVSVEIRESNYNEALKH